MEQSFSLHQTASLLCGIYDLVGNLEASGLIQFVSTKNQHLIETIRSSRWARYTRRRLMSWSGWGSRMTERSQHLPDGESLSRATSVQVRYRLMINRRVSILIRPVERVSPGDRQYLRDICSMPWFRRVWTIQEVTFATKCLLLCGYESISWDAFVLAAESESTEMYGEGTSTFSTRFRTFLTRVYSRRFHNNRNLAQASQRTWYILTKCRREEASDPRDKILGLFAILNSLGLTIPAPDYSKTPATVYEELTVMFIQQFKHLGLLELAFTFGRHPTVPTWVPDFNDRKFFIGVDTNRKLPKILVVLQFLLIDLRDNSLCVGRE
jgi:hypothetical protein